MTEDPDPDIKKVEDFLHWHHAQPDVCQLPYGPGGCSCIAIPAFDRIKTRLRDAEAVSSLVTLRERAESAEAKLAKIEQETIAARVAIGLQRSMIKCGEHPTAQSDAAVIEGLAALRRLDEIATMPGFRILPTRREMGADAPDFGPTIGGHDG